MNKIYVVNGETFEVSPDREADFLAAYPNAELVNDNQEVVEEQPQIDPILESAKKTQGPAEQAAIVGPQNIEQPNMELPLDTISLELPKKDRDYAKAFGGDIFKKQEEEAQTDLKYAFQNENLSFEQTGLGTDKIKIKYTNPDTKEEFVSDVLEFDTDNEDLIKANKEIMNSFLNQHLTEQEAYSIEKLDEKQAANALKELDDLVPQEVKQKINEEVESPDFFKPIAKTRTYQTGTGTLQSTNYIEPYKEDVEKQIASLKLSYPNAPEDKILQSAQSIVRAQQKEIRLSQARTNVIEQAVLKVGDEAEKAAPIGDQFGLARNMRKTLAKEAKLKKQSELYIGNLKALTKIEDIANRFKTASGLLNTINTVVKENKGATPEQTEDILESAQALGLKFERTGQDITLSNGQVIDSGFAKLFKQAHDITIADNEIYKGYTLEGAEAAAKTQELTDVVDAAGKNYSLGEKYATNLGLGITDIGFNLLYLGGKILAAGEYASPFGYYAPKPMNEALDNMAVNYATTANDIRSSYVSDVSFDDAFSSADNFGRFAMQEVTNQIPILVAMMASGGAAAYVVGASSAGGKMADMQTEIATGSADYTDSEIWLKSIGYGVAEGGFAALTTVPILNKAKATWIKKGQGSVIDNTSKQFAKAKVPGLIYDPLLEAAGEVATVGAQNLIDGNPFTVGMDHAGFSGAAFGLMFSGIPFLKGLHTSSFSDYNADKRIRDIKTEIGKLAATRENLTSETAINEIDSQIKTLSIDLATEINAQEDALKNLVTHKFGERITGIVEQQSNLKIQAQQVMDDATLDTQTKQSAIKRLQKSFDRLQNIKDVALSDSFKRKFEGEFKALEGTDKTAYDGYLAEAKETLFQEKNNTDSTQEEIFRKGHDLYLLDKVQESNKKLKNFKGFKIFKTQAEAIAAIEADNSIPEKDEKGKPVKAALIQNIKDGDDGGIYRKGDTRRIYVVEENQVLNQRKYIATHEVGHDVFWDILGTDPAAFDPIARQLLEGTKNVDDRLYKELSKETESFEVVSRFLELVAGGDVDFRKNEKKKGLAGLFGSMVQKQFEGDYDFDFKGETDMFNFVVGIGKKIADGSLTTADIKAARKSTIAQEVKGRVIPLPAPEARTKLTRAASAAKGKDLMQSLNKFSQNEDGSPKFASKEEWQRSSEAGEAYFTVQQTKLLEGEIRKQARLKGLPEDVDINEIKDNIALRVFENYDPSKNNLFGYLLGKVNIVEKAVLDAAKKFGSRVESTAASIDTAAGDVGAVAEIEADVTTVEEKQEREAKEEAEEASTFNLTTSNAIEPATIEKAKAKVLSIVRTLKNKLGQAVSKNVNTVPVVKEVIQSSAKSIDIDLKKQMGGKGDLKLRKFVIDNKTDIINNASATWLMGKDTGTEVKGGMPIAIEKSVGGKFTGKTIEINVGGKIVKTQEFQPNFVPYPEWVGQKIDREKTVERGQTSGNEIVRKVNPAKISDNAFADFVTTEDGTPIRGRKESLANELAGRLGGQIFKEAIADPESDISKAFEQNQDLRGAVLSDNFRNEVIEQTERGLIARSSGIKALQLIGKAERSPELVNKYTNAYNQPTKTARKNALKKLNEESTDQEKALIQLLQNNIDGSAEYANNISETRWAVSENQAINSLIELSKVNKDLKVIDPYTGKQIKSVKKALEVFGGNDPSLPDTLVEYKGVIFPIEIKAHKRAGLGSTVLKKLFNMPSDISTVKNPKTKKDFITNVYAEIAQTDKYKKLITFLDKIGVNRSVQPMRVTAEQLIAIEKEYGSIYKAFEFYSGLPVEYVHEHYANKKSKKDGTPQPAYYLNFSDLGLVSLGKNPFGWSIPRLEGPLTARVRVFKPKQNKDGSYTLSPKIHAELSTEAGNNIAAQSDQSIFSIAAFDNLLKNTNPALIQASKGKAEVETLNKQYDEHQKSLTARSKGKLNPEFNRIIERASGIGARKKLSAVVARKMGRNKGMFKLFLPPSAEDFRGLYYMMVGKGQQGEADKKFFKENLVKPYTRGVAAMEKAKQTLLNDYKALRKVFRQSFKEEGIKMKQEIPGAKLSVEQAMRIYLWSNADVEIPGLTPADQKKALEYVYKNPVVQAYADSLLAISKQDQWSQPTEYWDAQSILSDLTDIALNVNRKKYLEEFITNKDEIFSENNLNKVEAAFGKEARQAIEDIMYRMETGSNKPGGGDTIAKKWNNWLNNSVGAIMFFNRRSATLQLLSTVNFMNTGDNNPLKAGLAFANQPQYWKDWAMIFNSPKLKERRGGLKSDVQEAEIAAAAKGAKNKPLAIISYLLKIGFTPTQIADSVAIASGGAAFYRNRTNTYKKQGFDQAEAEAKAFEDFSEISDETQQSGDPMLISKQQASLMGRIVLAFQNTPMQITRFQKRDFQDLINRRRIEGKNQFQSDATYLSRIAYYTAVQNLIFSTLQNGLFTLLPGFDDEDEEGLSEKEIEKLQKKDEQKVQNVLNSMLDTTLRGSGLYGAVASTIKNIVIEYMRQQEKDPFSKDNTRVLLQAINLSPPLGSKARKIYNGLETMDYEKDVIAERGFGVKIDGKFQLSPSYQVLGNFTSAATNLPLDRIVSELDVVSEALDSRNTELQRLALALGWKSWEVGAEIEEHEAIKTTAKATRKAEGIEKRKKQAAEKREIETDAFKNMNGTEKLYYKKWKKENKGKRLYDYLKETDQL